MRFKEAYIEELERIASELEDEGCDPDEAYDRASMGAYDAARDRFADMADRLRQAEKDDRQ